MAGKFLLGGADNDIYDWVTGIFGAPWGSHSYSSSLIPGSTDEITILLFDIDGNNFNLGSGYTAGYFWSKDNFLSGSSNFSNERLMFYIDAPVFGAPDGGTWDITDYYPSEQISTLAHEFQHMINFYQKTVLHSFSYPDQRNELPGR